MKKETGTAAQFTSGGQVSDSGARALLLGYAFQVGTASQGSVTFRDGGSGGTIRWVDSNIAVTAAGDVCKVVTFPKPIVFTSDIYVALTGTDTSVCVEWAPINYGG